MKLSISILLLAFAGSVCRAEPRRSRSADHEALYPKLVGETVVYSTETNATDTTLQELDLALLGDTTPEEQTLRQKANDWLQHGDTDVHAKIDKVLLEYLRKNPQKLKAFGQQTVDEFVNQYFYPVSEGGALRAIPTDGDPFGPRFAAGTTREQVEMYYARSLRYFLTVKDLEDGAKAGIKKAKELYEAFDGSPISPAIKYILSAPFGPLSTQIP